MKNTVEGEEMDPAEFERPGWATIRHRQHVLRSAALATAQQVSPLHLDSKKQPRRKRPAQRTPPATPLPATDIKIVLRPRGGLALASLAQATLADAIHFQAHVAPNREDQVRVQQTANYVVISTPSEERAHKYASMTSLTVRGKQYEVSAHVAAPANSVVGVIFNIPEDDTPEQVFDSICSYNPDLQILDAKRLNSSNMAQILFDGQKVPFWIRYRSSLYRCKPFRRKTEACYACWSTGHRQDVCPNAQVTPRCPRCGATNPAEPHDCSPRCIVCEGPHITGSADCPRRYQPRRRASTYAQIVTTGSPALSNQGQSNRQQFPPLLQTVPAGRQGLLKGSPINPPAGQPQGLHAKHKHAPAGEQQATPDHQVSCPVASAHCSSINSPSPPFSSSMDILRELNAIRAEISLLRQENAALREENQALKSLISPRQEDSTSSTPPPTKRKAVSDDSSSSESPLAPDEQVQNQITELEVSCKQALTEQKAECSNIHQALEAGISNVHANVEALRLEFRNSVQELVNKINTLSNSNPALALNYDISRQ